MTRFRWSVLLAVLFLNCIVTTSDLLAQLRASPAQPEPSRGRIGILGVIREARDERFNRANPPPTPPSNPNVGSQANKPNTAPAPNVSGNRVATQQPSRNNGQQTLPPNPTRPMPLGNPSPGQKNSSTARTQTYPPASAQQNPTRIVGANSVNPSKTTLPNVSPNVAPVVAASALIPNRFPYTGPGIVIRLSVDRNAEVNYLVDDTEQLVIRPGEEHRLRLKGRYEVRFSRGVTEDQRSLGEARYTLIEGVYEFVITKDGWDLLRDPEGGVFPNVNISQASNQRSSVPKTANRLEQHSEVNIDGSRNLPLPSIQSIAPNPFEATNTLAPRSVDLEKRRLAPVPDEPVTEETLPSPTPEPSTDK